MTFRPLFALVALGFVSSSLVSAQTRDLLGLADYLDFEDAQDPRFRRMENRSSTPGGRSIG